MTSPRTACARNRFQARPRSTELFISIPSLQISRFMLRLPVPRPRSRLPIAFILLISLLSRCFAFHLPSLYCFANKKSSAERMRRDFHLLKFFVRIWPSYGSSLCILKQKASRSKRSLRPALSQIKQRMRYFLSLARCCSLDRNKKKVSRKRPLSLLTAFVFTQRICILHCLRPAMGQRRCRSQLKLQLLRIASLRDIWSFNLIATGSLVSRLNHPGAFLRQETFSACKESRDTREIAETNCLAFPFIIISVAVEGNFTQKAGHVRSIHLGPDLRFSVFSPNRWLMAFSLIFENWCEPKRLEWHWKGTQLREKLASALNINHQRIISRPKGFEECKRGTDNRLTGSSSLF